MTKLLTRIPKYINYIFVVYLLMAELPFFGKEALATLKLADELPGSTTRLQTLQNHASTIKLYNTWACVHKTSFSA